MKLKLGEQEWDFDTDKWRNDEIMAVERELGCSMAEFADQLNRGYMSAVTAAIWIYKRRENPKLRFAEVRFTMAEFDLVLDRDELRTAYWKVKTVEEREKILAAVDDPDDEAYITAEPEEAQRSVDPTQPPELEADSEHSKS